MSELLEFKMGAVPEMDPKQAPEHNGLNGLSMIFFDVLYAVFLYWSCSFGIVTL